MIEKLGFLTARARALGLVMSTETAYSAKYLHDTFYLLSTAVGSATKAIGAALAPVLSGVTETLLKLVIAGRDWIKANQTLVLSVFALGAGLVAAGTVLSGLGGAIAGVGWLFATFASVVGGIGSALAFLVSPIGLVIAGLAGLVTWPTGRLEARHPPRHDERPAHLRRGVRRTRRHDRQAVRTR